MSSEYEFEKYITTPENIMETINKYGVAIIPNLLNDEECCEMASGMWDTLETISQTWEEPINRNNNSTWKNIISITLNVNTALENRSRAIYLEFASKPKMCSSIC